MSEMCESCPYKGKMEVIQNTIGNHDELLKNYGNRLTEVEKQIIVINTNFNNIMSGINDTKRSVEELKEKPVKRWDTIVNYALTTIVGLLVGYIVKGVF